MMFANCVYVIIYVMYWAYCLYLQTKLYYYYTITAMAALSYKQWILQSLQCFDLDSSTELMLYLY